MLRFWLRKLFPSFLRRKVQPRRQFVRPRARLGLDVLEDRLAPATITVTSTDDTVSAGDHKVTLREAITAINAGNDLGDADISGQTPGTFGTNDTINFSIGTGVQTRSEEHTLNSSHLG